MNGVFVVGTDTDVGKTFASALLIQALMSGGIVPYYLKPVASGGHVDIDTIRNLTGITEFQSSSPIVFETPCSPHLAAELENRQSLSKESLKTQVIEKCRTTLKENKFTIIEGAGGIVVPIQRQGFDLYHLVKEIDLPVIIVTRTGVGTINHTMLTLEYLKAKQIKITGIVFNGFENTIYEEDNIRLIKERSGVPILGVIPKINRSIDKKVTKEYAENHIDLSCLLEKMTN